MAWGGGDRPFHQPAPDAPKQAAWALSDEDPGDAAFLSTFDGHLLLRFGLAAQVDLIGDSTFANTPAEFVVSSLPVEGDPNVGGGFNASVGFGQSRLHLAARVPTPAGPIDFVYDNNFMTQDGQYAYNLLRLFAQWHGLRVGYGYSAFTDSAILPATLDWEGPGSQAFAYNAQVRYMPVLHRTKTGKLILEVSAEAVALSLTGVDEEQAAFQRAPDGIVALGWHGDRFYLRTASVFRALASQTPTGSTTGFGWGVNTGISWQLGKRDALGLWGNVGDGYANYIEDLWGYGLDAIVEPNGQLNPLFAYGVGGSYTRGWSRAFSSTASFSFADVDTTDLQGLGVSVPSRTWYGSQPSCSWYPQTSLNTSNWRMSAVWS